MQANKFWLLGGMSWRFWRKEPYWNVLGWWSRQNFGLSEAILTAVEVGSGPAATYCNQSSDLLLKETKDKSLYVKIFFFFF